MSAVVDSVRGVDPRSDDVLISARGLTKAFGAFAAVDGIDFAVQPGEAFGFLGPNGAGKSSTMKTIGCVSPSTGGELRLFGLDPATHRPQIRARLGVVPQRDTLDEELTVEENLWIYGRYFGLSRREVRARATAGSSPSGRRARWSPTTPPARCSSCGSTPTTTATTPTPSPASASGRRCCPTGSWSTPTTATRRPPRSTPAASSRCPRWCAERLLRS